MAAKIATTSTIDATSITSARRPVTRIAARRSSTTSNWTSARPSSTSWSAPMRTTAPTSGCPAVVRSARSRSATARCSAPSRDASTSDWLALPPSPDDVSKLVEEGAQLRVRRPVPPARAAWHWRGPARPSGTGRQRHRSARPARARQRGACPRAPREPNGSRRTRRCAGSERPRRARDEPISRSRPDRRRQGPTAPGRCRRRRGSSGGRRRRPICSIVDRASAGRSSAARTSPASTRARAASSGRPDSSRRPARVRAASTVAPATGEHPNATSSAASDHPVRPRSENPMRADVRSIASRVDAAELGLGERCDVVGVRQLVEVGFRGELHGRVLGPLVRLGGEPGVRAGAAA